MKGRDEHPDQDHSGPNSRGDRNALDQRQELGADVIAADCHRAIVASDFRRL
jgi:hypothetical protein